jgi:hypothetical protein
MVKIYVTLLAALLTMMLFEPVSASAADIATLDVHSVLRRMKTALQPPRPSIRKIEIAFRDVGLRDRSVKLSLMSMQRGDRSRKPGPGTTQPSRPPPGLVAL